MRSLCVLSELATDLLLRVGPRVTWCSPGLGRSRLAGDVLRTRRRPCGLAFACGPSSYLVLSMPRAVSAWREMY
jgi:hypothetical protein